MAIQEIYETLGWQGIDKLAKRCEEPRLVGWELVKEPFDRDDLVQWLCQWYATLRNDLIFDSFTSGVLHAVPQEEFIDFLQTCLGFLEKQPQSSEQIAGFIANAPQSMDLWQLVEIQPSAVNDHFWFVVRPFYIRSSSDQLSFCMEKLLNAGRPRTAMEAIGARAPDLPGELLIQMLKGIASGQESNAPLPRSWHIARIFKALSEKECSQSELVSLEFAYYKVLESDEHGAPHLMAEILSEPASFMELIYLVFRPHSAEPEPIPENLHASAETAGSLLHNGRGVPGRGSNGNINIELFFKWINRVREVAKDKDREAVTDLTVGTWLSDWPLNKNLECWPDPVIAELLDKDDCNDIRRGFRTGVYNSRGVTSRMPYDGGKQEREVAEEFRHFSTHWKDSKTNVAAMIESLAESYEQEARRHDEDGLWAQEW